MHGYRRGWSGAGEAGKWGQAGVAGVCGQVGLGWMGWLVGVGLPGRWSPGKEGVGGRY